MMVGFLVLASFTLGSMLAAACRSSRRRSA